MSLRRGTVSDIDPLKIKGHGSTVEMPVTHWVPTGFPTVNDQVLYDVVEGEIAIVYNITNPQRILEGSISSGTLAASGSRFFGSVAITFPTGWFDSAPRVYPAINSSSPVDMTVMPSGSSTAGATLNVVSDVATARNLWWLAVLN